MRVPRGQRRQQEYHMLPGPYSFGLETVRRGLVRTNCRIDSSIVDQKRHRCGTGVLLGTNADGLPEYVLTSLDNCLSSEQWLEVRHGPNWAYATPLAQDETLGIALLKLRYPMRLSIRGYPSHGLAFAHIDESNEPGSAMMIGYYWPLRRYSDRFTWPIREEVQPATISYARDFQTGKRHHEIFATFKPGMEGSPIFAKKGIIGLAVRQHHLESRRMVVVDWRRLRGFVESALQAGPNAKQCTGACSP